MNCFKILSALLLILLVNLTSAVEDLLKAHAAFTADFFHHITEGNTDKNVLVSPLSVETCLAIAYAGAKGTTANEIAKSFNLTSKNQLISERIWNIEYVSPTVQIVNRVYVGTSAKIMPEFNNVVKSAFNVEAENLDFTNAEDSANTINKWIESNTNNQIMNLVSQSTVRDAHMILVNAIHLKAEWLKEFSHTMKSDFWYNETSKTQTDMMKQTNLFKYAEIKELDARVIALPFLRTHYAMYVILPNKRDGLQELANLLEYTDLTKIDDRLQSTKVNLNLPKFEIEYDIILNNVLKEMGMKTMFTDNADFSNLVEDNTKISKIVHKAVIKIDENGSQDAGAVSAIKDSVSNANHDKVPVEFNVDHPFVFAIMGRIIIFLGHVVKF